MFSNDVIDIYKVRKDDKRFSCPRRILTGKYEA